MILIKNILFSLFFVFTLLGPTWSQNLLDYSNSLKYADYLFKTNQYNLATVEFERIVYLEPNDTLSKLKLIRSYRYLTEYQTALNRIEMFFPYRLKNLPEEFSNEYVINMFHENQFQKATAFLQTIENMDIGVRTDYQLGLLILQNQWTEASSFVDEHLEVLDKSKRFIGLNNIVLKGLNTNYKSPILAASISAVVPGGGKVYSGRWKDAIYSFLFVTTSSWFTYKSYQNNGFSINSVLLGSFALSFYSADIYGSVQSAKKFNQKKNLSFRSQAENILFNDQKR